MILPTHTPYDGSSKPFTAGLTRLDLSDWIEIDSHFHAYIAEKRRLYATLPEKVLVEESDTRDAQREVLDLLRAHLKIPDQDQTAAEAPLQTASLLVQEDLILMRRGDNGWRLVAGSLCFPSSWSLEEKFGHPLAEIHAPVPGFGPGSRMAEIINRMFDSLKVEQPMQRFNWSIQAGDALYHPLSNDGRIERATERPARFPDDESLARAFVRVERQTLRKLPVSRDILFTIRIYLDPLTVLARHPDRAELARSFAGQLASLDPEQLDYKGMTSDRDRLIAMLEAMAARA